MELWQVTGWPSASSETCAPPCVASRTACATSTPGEALMATVAPKLFANSSFSSVRSTATTLAPSALAIMIADSPTPPQPCTATHSPGRTLPWSTTARKAVVKRQPRLAAVANSIVSGTETRLVSAKSIATYSANEPQAVKPGWNCCSQTWWLPLWHSKQVPQPQTKGEVTRSPSRQRVTRAPTAVTVPASSWPGTCGRWMSGSCPCQPCQSLRQRPVASTFTTTPPGAGDGSSSRRMVGATPNWS